MKNIQEFLPIITELGLKPQEAKVYLALLSLGQSNVGLISAEAKVQRTFVYDILKDLAEKGLVSYVQYKGRRYYSAVSSQRLLSLQQEKTERFSSLLPELRALERTVGDQPKVQYFEGREGIIAAFEDTLEQPKDSELLVYSTGEGFYENDPQYAQSYLDRRVKKNILVRAIAPNNPETRRWTDRDAQVMRTTRLVSAEQFPFSNEINIYGNKVAIISLVGEWLAVIIDSESIAKTQRSIFELAWKGAEKS